MIYIIIVNLFLDLNKRPNRTNDPENIDEAMTECDHIQL